MKKKVTISELYSVLEEAVKDFPDTLVEHTHKTYKSDFFTLLCTILSARTKDSLTITKLPELWKNAKTPLDYIKIDNSKLEKLLYPIGFYKTKAKHIKEMARVLHEQFNDKLPDTIEGLITLPGVGRKTANLVVSVVFDKPAICVDTHVHRIMNHIGYVKTETPEQTEIALRKKLPVELWNPTNRILVKVGQYLANHVTINNPDNILNKYTLTEHV